eukprot:m.172599 g.172599  ORF g.172599 m.172599 type:complete len:366 (+) comp15375_c1_seq4:2668-3765(+)
MAARFATVVLILALCASSHAAPLYDEYEQLFDLAATEPPTRIDKSCMARKVHEALNGITCPTASPFTGVTLEKDRDVHVFALYGFETDLLEIALHQYKEGQVSRVHLIETDKIHQKSRGIQKTFSAWEKLKHTERFNQFDSLVEGVEVKAKSGHELFESEQSAEQEGSAKVRLQLNSNSVTIAASIDELLSLQNLWYLRHCEIAARYTVFGSAIAMPMGKLGRLFRTDWPANGYAYSFNLPTIYIGPNSNHWFQRKFQAPNRDATLYGGLHLTCYCYPPAFYIKTVTETEGDYPRKPSPRDFCNGMDHYMQECFNKWAHRTRSYRMEDEKIYKVPVALDCNPDRYPTWYGREDPRMNIIKEKWCK